MNGSRHGRRPRGTPYAGVAATPRRGKPGIFGGLLNRRESNPNTVDYRTFEPSVRRAAADYRFLEVVTRGVLGSKRILVLDKRGGGTHLEFTKDSVKAESELGKIIAIRAGVTQFVSEVTRTMCTLSKPFEQLHRQGVIQYDQHSKRFLVHIVDEPIAREVRLGLPEPYKSFFVPHVAKANMHSANESISRAIRESYPRVEVTGVHSVHATRKDRPTLSIATVTRDDGLHVSLHERPSYVADTNAQRPEDRVGATVFFIERELSRGLISTLKAMHVKRLYLLTTSGLKIRTVIDLDRAEYELQFRAPEC